MLFLAEYLSRIASISVTSDAENVPVEWDRSRIRVNDCEFALPAEVFPGKARQKGCLCLRIPVKEELPENFTHSTSDWSAKTFSSCREVQCIKCDKVLLKNPLKWHQKPSEYWTELMDLWHCHKPTHDEMPAAESMYSKPLNLIPQPGLVLVGETYLQPHSQDIAACRHCYNTDKIWMCDIKTDDGRTMSPEVLISSILMGLVDSHAIYSFFLNSRLLIWIFNADIRYTTSSIAGRGLKILFADDRSKIHDLRQTRSEIEDIDLPEEIFQKLLARLQESFVELPKLSQWLGQWKVGFLSYDTLL